MEIFPLETIVTVLIIIAMTIYFHFDFTERSIDRGPTLLTTVGILATFVGIALGLLHFDAKQIESSLPALISGLKTAFWGSVVGVGGALTIKLREYAFGKDEILGSGERGEVTGEDLAKLLLGIQHSLVGSDDSTLITQLKLSRQDANDRLDALRRAQTEALEKMSQLGSKALIEALRDVIRDFNVRLTEQFGDNFKQLNEAVGKLLTWQNEYKLHVEKTSAQLASIVDSMGSSSQHYQNLVIKAETFTQTARNLSELLVGLETQRAGLVGALESLTRLIAAVSSDLPRIEAKFGAITEQMSAAVLRNQSDLNKALIESSQHLKSSIEASGAATQKTSEDLASAIKVMLSSTQASLADAARQLQGSVDESGKAVAKSHSEANKLLQESVSETKRAILSSADELRKSVENCGKDLVKANAEVTKHTASITEQTGKLVTEMSAQMRTTIEAVSRDVAKVNGDLSRQMAESVAKSKDQITLLDKALAEELQKSLESLGNQLAALSKKFVSDYTPLTDRLREILQIANRVQ